MLIQLATHVSGAKAEEEFLRTQTRREPVARLCRYQRMFSPFSSFPVPPLGAQRHDPHHMEWLGWPGMEYVSLEFLRVALRPDDTAIPEIKPVRETH